MNCLWIILLLFGCRSNNCCEGVVTTNNSCGCCTRVIPNTMESNCRRNNDCGCQDACDQNCGNGIAYASYPVLDPCK